MWLFPKQPDSEGPKVLILVLSALRAPWGEMLDVQRSTWNTVPHPQTQTLFYCGKFAGVPPSWPDVYFSEQYGESLEEICPRTREAFEHALGLEWDYLARTHSSTYVHKKNLVDFIEKNELPGDNLFCGLTVAGDLPFVWGGGGYIMSRDVIERFVIAKDQWDLGMMEDRALSKLATQLKVPWNGSGKMASINELQDGSYFVMGYGSDSFNSREWSDLNKLHPNYYIRVKQDLRRERDLDLMRQIHKYMPA